MSGSRILRGEHLVYGLPLKSTNDLSFVTLSRSIVFVEELVSIFTITAAEEGILGTSSWADVWNSKEEIDVFDYYEDFEVSRIDLGKQNILK